jgi:hypothetical protein
VAEWYFLDENGIGEAEDSGEANHSAARGNSGLEDASGEEDRDDERGRRSMDSGEEQNPLRRLLPRRQMELYEDGK